ncbi:MAG: hypothetical protein LUF33_04055 [Clostridiales bacterium]|nr:hypothetical protein [Clostridiales bacterium]
MNKKFYLSLIIICLTAAACFSGCGANEISFYMGTSENAGENVKLELNTPRKIEQNKEKTENSELVFNANGDGEFDSIYLCFSGNNIKSVVGTSENKTILYDGYDTVSLGVDYFLFYFYPDESEVDEYYDAELDLESRWDKGEFDDIRNVFFNGMSIYDISRFREDADKMIATVGASLYTVDEMNTEQVSNEFYYLDRKKEVDEQIVYADIFMLTASDKEFPEDDNYIIQGESVETNTDIEQDSFIYRYEKLFYNSQQAALESKGSFDYDDLSGETLEMTVNYRDNTSQSYKIEIAFDEEGNITAELGE